MTEIAWAEAELDPEGEAVGEADWESIEEDEEELLSLFLLLLVEEVDAARVEVDSGSGSGVQVEVGALERVVVVEGATHLEVVGSG